MKTMTDKVALAISFWVVLAGSYVCLMHPERRWQCLLGMGVLGLAWTIRQVLRESSPVGKDARRSITQSIVFAGLLLSVGLAEAMAWVDVQGEFRVRACQFLAGVMVIVIGNMIPKKAIASRRLAALLRGNGKAFVLGGLGYALAWLFLPLAYANPVALTSMLLAFAYVITRIVVCLVRRNQSAPPHGPA